MRNVRLVLIAVVMLVLAGLACCPAVQSPTVEVPTMVPATEPPPPTVVEATPAPEGASLEITNTSGREVWYVYLSPVEAEEWGEDWLGGETIPDGGTYTISGIPEGTYDVKAEDSGEEIIEVFGGVEIEGDMTWDITGLATLKIVNHSDDTISFLYVVPAEETSWGADWLEGDVIEPDGSYLVEGLDMGNYDVKVAQVADDEDGQALVEAVFNVPVSGTKTWTVVGKTALPGNAVLRFEDDFENNANNWGLDTETENAFYMSPQDGEYCILIKSENFTAWEWYEPFRTDEFVGETACRIDTPDADASCGLGFGADGDNIYWFEISPSDQTFALFLLVDGEWQEKLVDWTTSRTIFPDGTNYLSMERVGGTMSLYVNSILVAEADGSYFPEGRLGIGGSTYSVGDVTICLDNLRVWRLE